MQIQNAPMSLPRFEARRRDRIWIWFIKAVGILGLVCWFASTALAANRVGKTFPGFLCIPGNLVSSMINPSWQQEDGILPRDLILKIDDVWETKYKAFQILAAQKHLWHYYERVALNRGIQGSRNTGIPMTYGEAYQTLFPRVVTETMG